MSEETEENKLSVVRPPRKISRPQISVQIPTNIPPGYPPFVQSSITPGLLTIPVSPENGLPVNFLQAYPNKASEFMFKRFKGFKDFTMKSAKSGLSSGEKFAFWMYNKMRLWSKQWFTHIFLFFVVCCYCLLGALLFVAVEGPIETKFISEIRRDRESVLNKTRQIWEDYGKSRKGLSINEDYDKRLADSVVLMREYENLVIRYQKQGFVDKSDKPMWAYWNAVFYCGTIFTTIGFYALIFGRLSRSVNVRDLKNDRGYDSLWVYRDLWDPGPRISRGLELVRRAPSESRKTKQSISFLY